MELADLLGPPTFDSSAGRLYRRLIFVVRAGRIERVFYPVFPTDGHAVEVLRWLDSRY